MLTNCKEHKRLHLYLLDAFNYGISFSGPCILQLQMQMQTLFFLTRLLENSSSSPNTRSSLNPQVYMILTLSRDLKEKKVRGVHGIMIWFSLGPHALIYFSPRLISSSMSTSFPSCKRNWLCVAQYLWILFINANSRNTSITSVFWRTP